MSEMRISSSRFLLSVACAACMLTAPSAANAAVTLGPPNPLPSTDPSTFQEIADLAESVRFTTEAPTGVTLQAPFDGVITSWQVYTGQVKGESTVQLKVLKPEGTGKWAIVGTGPRNVVPEFGTPSVAVQHVFPTRIPVTAGQMVGVAYAPAPGGYVQWVRPVNQLGYTDACFSTFCLNSVPAENTAAEPLAEEKRFVPMNATLEPDANHNGYGDETQEPTPCLGAIGL